MAALALRNSEFREAARIATLRFLTGIEHASHHMLELGGLSFVAGAAVCFLGVQVVDALNVFDIATVKVSPSVEAKLTALAASVAAISIGGGVVSWLSGVGAEKYYDSYNGDEFRVSRTKTYKAGKMFITAAALACAGFVVAPYVHKNMMDTSSCKVDPLDWDAKPSSYRLFHGFRCSRLTL